MQTTMIDETSFDFMRTWERSELGDELELNDEGEIKEDEGREVPTEGLPVGL